ncbi:MAG: hypothetical protein HXY39_04905 [Chloroflexi bacterium]|nr:hypothetical protein [Chloroflexota bacterium]
MTESIAAEVQQLIMEGRAAALAGDTFTARTRFRRAVELDSDNAEAWLGLSGVVPILAEKREYLQRVLALDPANAEAAASLTYVEQLQAEGLQIAPSQRRQERRASGDASPLLAAPDPPVTAAVEVTYCYNHPDRETGLRCVQCNRPICGSCAQITPTGQLCPQCRKARRPPQYQAEASHMLIGGITGLFAALLGSIVVLFLSSIPFLGLFLALMAGPLTGELTVRIVEQLTRKRGRAMQAAVGTGLALGGLPLLGFGVMALLVGGAFLQVLLLGLWLTLMTITAVARLR